MERLFCGSQALSGVNPSKLGSPQNNGSWLLSGDWLFQELLGPRELSYT